MPKESYGPEKCERVLDKMINLPKDVKIVAVTKIRSIDEIKKAIAEEIKIIGENRIQEAEKKYNELRSYLKEKNVEFHFIGHLQKNKVKKAVMMFDLIQSVDSIELAKELDKRAKELDKVQDILIQVNIGNEPQKSGIKKYGLNTLVDEVIKLKNIKLKGLMCIVPDFEDKEKTRPYFKDMKKRFDETKLEILSMGMSDDYKIAVEEGSNMVRLGRAIFGERN